jgi:NAD-dependent deacetylase sirtuin 2
LLIIAGTSLVVSPANSLVTRVPPSTRRIVINNEKVGTELGLQYGADSGRDSFIGGDCEGSFLELTARLGWLPDLDRAALPVASQTALDAVLEAGDASDVCPS